MKGARAAAITAALVALPTVVARFPPMSDLPLHAAVVGLLLRAGDARFVPPGLYERNLGHPNQLFHLLALPLAAVVGATSSAKLVAAAAQVSIVLGGARLARFLGASAWSALLLVPLAVGWSFHLGLVANMLGLGALLFLLPGLFRDAREPSGKGALRGVASLVLLYLAHESALGVALVAIVLFLRPRAWRSWRDPALALAPVLFVVALLGAQLTVQHRLLAAGGGSAGGPVWQSPLASLVSMPHLLAGAGAGSDVAEVALFLVTLAATALFAGRPARGESAPVARRPFALLALACLGGLLVFPFGFAGGTAFNLRFFAPAFALAVLVLAARSGPTPSLLARVAAGVVALFFVVANLPAAHDADVLNRDFDTLAVRLEPGAAVACIEADPNKGERAFGPSTICARAVALAGGRATQSFTDSPISPMFMPPEHRWTQSEARLRNNSVDFAPAYDLHLYRYVFVHAANPVLLDVAPTVLTEASLLGRAGEWSLFASRLPLVSPAGAEPPWPEEDPETFRVRAIRALHALGS